MSMTIGLLLARNRGFGPGFDFLRVALAISIVLIHAKYILLADGGENGVWWFSRFALLPMFFVLSGFLVIGSAQRLNLRDFLINRGARIIPALFTEILLSACVVGPLLTTLPLSEYFSQPEFFSYFWNIVGYIHYGLPGLFQNNPIKGVVNVSLWTIPHEIACYVLMSVVIYLGLVRTKKGIAAIVVASAAVFVAPYIVGRLGAESLFYAAQVISHAFSQLVIYFIIGSVCFVYRDYIPYSWMLFVACCVACCAISIIGTDSWRLNHAILLRVLTAPILSYIVVFVGMTPVPKLPLFGQGDYSYGIYLYGFPLQQVALQLFPDVWNIWTFNVASIVLATIFAIFSWHVIEKPALAIRKSFSTTMRDHTSAQPLGIRISDSAGQDMPSASLGGLQPPT